MPKLKLPPEDVDRIIEALNTTKTVTDAADVLDVTRQALRIYMNANGIERICEYRQTSRSIEVKSDDSAKSASAVAGKDR